MRIHDSLPFNPIQTLDAKVDRISEELAAQKSIGEIVKYLVYFWAAISAILGIFGWSKFSDIDKLIEVQVRNQLPQDKQDFADFKARTAEVEGLHKKYKELAKDYEESVAALQYSKTLGVGFDIEGRLLVLFEDVNRRKDENSIENIDDLTGSVLESKWRKEAIATVWAFKDSLQKNNYPADFIFNVTQVTRKLSQFQLAEELTKAAFEKDPSPPIRAMYLSSRVATTTGQVREDSFNELMNMVVNLSLHGPEIVLSEAWNAAEDRRRYTELNAAIDKLASSGRFVPSFAFVIRARSALRRSMNGDVSEAERSLQTAIASLANESALSSWFKPAVSGVVSVNEKIGLTKATLSGVSGKSTKSTISGGPK